VRNEEVLHIVKDKNTQHILEIRKANWIGHILHGNRFLKHVVERMIEVRGRQGRRYKQLPDGNEEDTGNN
jgi:hypothetical protein